jgi:hypothetical protein
MKGSFIKRAEVKAIHAGLECGLFLEKYPQHGYDFNWANLERGPLAQRKNKYPHC